MAADLWVYTIQKVQGPFQAIQYWNNFRPEQAIRDLCRQLYFIKNDKQSPLPPFWQAFKKNEFQPIQARCRITTMTKSCIEVLQIKFLSQPVVSQRAVADWQVVLGWHKIWGNS
jgi:hypothetical protein